MTQCAIFKENPAKLEPVFIGSCDLTLDDYVVVRAVEKESGLYHEIAGMRMTGDGL